jgi:hypothetical protein
MMLISRTLQAALAASALAVAAAAPAQAQSANANATAAARAGTPEVVSRGPNGRPMTVRIDGTVYKVCMTQNEDGCIQPRAAGLNWGNHPLGHWPGRPASEIRGGARVTATTTPSS